jgi:pimeloyl-ACP methyl ester carboxylesterase
MATFVLVPGSWIGAWTWRRVEPLLREAGHQVHAITLTALGDRAHLGDGDTNLSTHVEDVVALIEAEELSDVVLVGHSYAGVAVAGVAERIPGRIAHVIYLAAALPVDGKSLFDHAGEDFTSFVRGQSKDGRWPFISDEELSQYYGDHEISTEDLAWMRRHAVGHPLGTYAEASVLGNPEAAALPKTYIRCTADQAPELPGDRSSWGYAELATGHWPMVTRPAELAALLDKTARG